MKEAHGLWGVKHSAQATSEKQLTVADSLDRVYLLENGSSYAMLTVEEALYLSRLLAQSAKRVIAKQSAADRLHQKATVG